MIRVVDTFPELMEGEAIFSAVAHYHLCSGNGAQSHSHMELFGQRAVRATFDLPTFIQALADRLPAGLGIDAGRLAKAHTQVAYLTAFLPRGDADLAVRSLIAGDPSLHIRLGVNASVVSRPDHLRFCEGCLKQMHERAGRYWWRLDHQLPGVFVCAEHGTVLKKSTVPFASQQFAFLASTDETCPQDAEPVLGDVGADLLAKLLDVAVRSAAVSKGPPRFGSYEEVTDHYRGRLFEADLMKTARHLDVSAFEDAWHAFYRDLEPIFEPVFGKAASDGAWVLEMARKHTQAKHPLQHILFEMFLDGRPKRVPPFGDGPWACPNPIAGHGKDALTIERVSERREGHGLVGTFECGCGYVYTMSVDSEGELHGPRYRCFGPLLDPALTQMVEAGTTLRGAASALGIHPRAVAAAAKRLGLGVAWKAPDRTGPRLGRATQNPRRSRRVEYPKPSRRPSKPRVDWPSLDLEMRKQAMEVVMQIRAASPVVFVSLKEVERRLGRQESWIYLRREKLPLTTTWLEGELETVEEFQERRLRDVIRRQLDEGISITASGVVRAASLKWEIWADRAKAMIADVPS